MGNTYNTITILIPTYRRPKTLARCLTCITEQVIPASEVIVVVRHAESDSTDVLEEFKKIIPNLKVVSVNEPGVVAAENAGLREVTSELVAFLDDDGYARKDWIQRILLFFSTHPYATGFGGGDVLVQAPWSHHDHPKKKVGVFTWYGRVIGNHHRKIIGPPREVQVLKGVNMVFKRNAFDYLDERLAGRHGHHGNGSQWELDICLRVLNNGGRLYFDPELLVDHDSNHSSHDLFLAAKNNAHNLAYVILKNVSIVRKTAFIVFSIIIGNSQIPGFSRLVLDFIRSPRLSTIKLFVIKWKGFFEGFYTYWSSL